MKRAESIVQETKSTLSKDVSELISRPSSALLRQPTPSNTSLNGSSKNLKKKHAVSASVTDMKNVKHDDELFGDQNMGADATIRFLKARVHALSEQLEVLVSKAQEKVKLIMAQGRPWGGGWIWESGCCSGQFKS